MENQILENNVETKEVVAEPISVIDQLQELMLKRVEMNKKIDRKNKEIVSLHEELAQLEDDIISVTQG